MLRSSTLVEEPTMGSFALHDAAGVIGSIIVIVAYFATQAGWLGANDPRFAWANLAGAALIITSLMVDWNLAAFVMEVFWILISIYGLARHHAVKRR
jgi:purine-cytosine permease-like protein